MDRHSSDNGSNWTDCTADQEFVAGSYLIRVKANGTVLASWNQSVTITTFNPSKEPTPSATFTAAGTDSGTLSNVTSGMEYSLDSGSTWVAISDTTVSITSGVTTTNGIQVKKPGNGTTTVDSDAQTIAVTKAETPNLTAQDRKCGFPALDSADFLFYGI